MKRRMDDALWKGLLENTFDDFLRFFFSNADTVFDLEKEFTYLDKELADLFPQQEGKAPRHVDKLVKVFTKEGEAKWVLVHIEIQGQKDVDFAFRMFTYYYRILDRYRMPVTAIAIFTDPVKGFCPSSYEQSFMGTGNVFHFNTYKVLGQDELALENSDNPFAVAILTVLLELKRKKMRDEELFELKYKLLRNLYRRSISKDKINSFLLFLQLYVNFEKPFYKIKFEEVIDKINLRDTTMGMRELILERVMQDGVEKGIKVGIKKGIKEGIEKGMSQKESEMSLTFVLSLIKETDFDDRKIAELVGVTVEFVENLRKKRIAQMPD